MDNISMSIGMKRSEMGIDLEMKMVLRTVAGASTPSDDGRLGYRLMELDVNSLEMLITYIVVVRCLDDNTIAFVVVCAISLLDPHYRPWGHTREWSTKRHHDVDSSMSSLTLIPEEILTGMKGRRHQLARH
jgi:hypothetical protein